MTRTGSVERSFDLLEFLASIGRAASLKEVADVTHLPKPTCYRLLASLQKLGYVSRAPGKSEYLLGPRMARLASIDPYAGLKAAARPLLQRLHGALNETVNLGVLSGTRVLYVEFIETTRPLRYVVTPGESDPYYATALGRAIAATLEDDVLTELLAKTVLKPQTPDGIRSKSELIAELKRARQAGYAEESNQAVEGVTCHAVALGFLGFPEAAISVAVPASRLTPKLRREIIQAFKTLH